MGPQYRRCGALQRIIEILHYLHQFLANLQKTLPRTCFSRFAGSIRRLANELLKHFLQHARLYTSASVLSVGHKAPAFPLDWCLDHGSELILDLLTKTV